MFVTSGAKEAIQFRRKNETLMSLITELILEANRLNITKKELIGLMDEVDLRRRGRRMKIIDGYDVSKSYGEKRC